jgi:hypothetical protein
MNIFLIFFNANLSFLFTAALPTFIYSIGIGLASFLGVPLWGTIGLIGSLLFTALYFLFWFLSKKRRVFLLIAFLLFGLDFLVFGYAIVRSGFYASLTIDLLFHAYVLYSLFIGMRAWAQLRRVPPDVIMEVAQHLAPAPPKSSFPPASASNPSANQPTINDDMGSNNEKPFDR